MCKTSWIAAVSVLGWLVGGYLIAFGAPGPLTDVSLPALSGEASAASSEDRAAATSAAIAQAKLLETLGRDQTILHADGTTEVVPALQLDGRQLGLSALERKSFQLRARVTMIEAGRTSAEFSHPVDAWVSVWERTGIAVPGWPGSANLEVVVILEDRTDKVLSVDVVLYDPAAPVQPPGTDTRTTCIPTQGFDDEARVCWASSE
jgi:hypothetical protein